MDRIGVRLAAFLALLLLLPAASLLAQGPLFPQIAGTYEVREETVGTGWTGNVMTMPETRDTQLWTSEIRQVGNRFSYSTKTPPGFPVIRYPGSLIGNDVVISTTTGFEQLPQFADLPIVENRYTATGTVENGRLVLRGVARLGVKLDKWRTLTFDLRVTTTFTGPFTPAPVGRIQLANTDRMTGTVSGLGIYRNGDTATLTASWAPGSYFVGWWADNGPRLSTEPTLTFTVNGSRKIRAVFAPVPAAVYVGLLQSGAQPTNDGVGSWRASLNAGGTFSGVVVLQGESHRFLGRFDREWKLEQVLARRGRSSLRVSLRLNPITRELDGSVTSEGEAFSAAMKGWPAQQRVSDAQWRYNSLMPAPWWSSSVPWPRGSGYLTMRIRGSGSVQAVGRLGEGTPFACGTRSLSSGSIPLHAIINAQANRSERGNFFGLLGGFSLGGPVYAFVPARRSARYFPEGIAYAANISATEWRPANFAPGNYSLTFTGGGLVDAGGQPRTITKALTVRASRAAFITDANPERVSIVFYSDGIFSGSFIHPSTRTTVRFFGIVETEFSDFRAAGFVLGPTESGLVSITPRR